MASDNCGGDGCREVGEELVFAIAFYICHTLNVTINLAADEDGRGSRMSLRVSVEGKVIIASVRTCKGVPWRSGQRLKSLGRLWRRAERHAP